MLLLLLLNIFKRYQKSCNKPNNHSDRPTRQRMIRESDKRGKRIETNGEKETHSQHEGQRDKQTLLL
jgi:hypothetical protein